jgi:hypothetical protein
LRHTEAMQVPCMSIAGIGMELLLGDEVVLKQQLTVMVGRLARD